MGELDFSTKERNQLNYFMFIFNLLPKLDYLARIDSRNTQNIRKSGSLQDWQVLSRGRIRPSASFEARRVSELGFILHSHYTAVLVHGNLGGSSGRFDGVARFEDLVEFLKL